MDILNKTIQGRGTKEEPFIIREATQEAGIRLEYSILEKFHGKRNIDWNLKLQSVVLYDNSYGDCLQIVLKNGRKIEYWFDLGVLSQEKRRVATNNNSNGLRDVGEALISIYVSDMVTVDKFLGEISPCEKETQYKAFCELFQLHSAIAHLLVDNLWGKTKEAEIIIKAYENAERNTASELSEILKLPYTKMISNQAKALAYQEVLYSSGIIDYGYDEYGTLVECFAENTNVDMMEQLLLIAVLGDFIPEHAIAMFNGGREYLKAKYM